MSTQFKQDMQLTLETDVDPIKNGPYSKSKLQVD